MKRRIENYIPQALAAIEYVKIPKDNMIAKPFNGYIASFGASIRQAGLLSTVLFYTNSKNSEEDRSKIIDAIEYIIEEKLTSEVTKKREIKLKVLDAATALKLAIRTYPQPKE